MKISSVCRILPQVQRPIKKTPNIKDGHPGPFFFFPPRVDFLSNFNDSKEIFLDTTSSFFCCKVSFYVLHFETREIWRGGGEEFFIRNRGGRARLFCIREKNVFEIFKFERADEFFKMSAKKSRDSSDAGVGSDGGKRRKRKKKENK